MYIQVIQLQGTEGAPEVADSGGPPAHGRWSGGVSPPLLASCASEMLLLILTDDVSLDAGVFQLSSVDEFCVLPAR